MRIYTNTQVYLVNRAVVLCKISLDFILSLKLFDWRTFHRQHSCTLLGRQATFLGAYFNSTYNTFAATALFQSSTRHLSLCPLFENHKRKYFVTKRQ